MDQHRCSPGIDHAYPAHAACMADAACACRAFLQQGVSVWVHTYMLNKQNGTVGSTHALTIAACHGHVSALLLMLKHMHWRHHVQLQDRCVEIVSGLCRFSQPCLQDVTRIYGQLLHLGVSLHEATPSFWGFSPLMIACNWPYLPGVQVFMKPHVKKQAIQVSRLTP